MRFFLFRPLAALTLGLLAGAAGLLPAASAQDLDDTLIRQAKEAFQKRDKDRLSALKTAALDARYPLAPWIDYWDLSSRLGEVSAPRSRPSTPAGPAAMWRTGCATTGCWSWASGATGPAWRASTRTSGWTTTARSPATRWSRRSSPARP
jgi:hypothetical protein